MRCKVCDYRLWNLPSRRCPECGTEFRPSEFEFVPNSVRFCCPHCNQAYYGTGPRGHLVPYAFDCVSCGRPINMDEMILLPAEGVREEHTAVGDIPWLERGKYGFFRAWLRTIGMAMGSPMALIRRLSFAPGDPIGFGFALLTVAVSLMVGALFPCGLPMAVGFAASPAGGELLLIFLVGVLFEFLLVLAVLVIWPLITHFMLHLLGGSIEPLRRTYQAFCFSAGAGVCLAFPCLGVYGIGWIWWIVSAILMVKEGHRISGGKATAAVLTAPALAVVGFATLYVGGMYFVISRMPTVATTKRSVIYVQTTTVSEALFAYAESHNGSGPTHILELVDDQSLSPSDFVIPGQGTFKKGVPVGDTTLNRFERLAPRERKALVDQVVANVAPGTIAYRLGDYVFTYPGIDLRNADPQLWLFIEIPVNVQVSSFQMSPYEVSVAGGGTTIGFTNDLARALKDQNRVRARNGLPPLPDPRTVTHEAPAVVPGWTPASAPADSPSTRSSPSSGS